MIRLILVAISVTAMLAACARFLADPVQQAWATYQAASDPVALSDLQLRTAATPERIGREIDEALAADDPDLAESFVDLADRQHIEVSQDQRTRLRAEQGSATWRSTRDFARGAVIGDVDGVAGLSGAFAGDLVGIGDVRDLSREGWHFASREPVDYVVTGLAAVGLAVTASTWLSAGAVTPARGGLTLLKGLKKAGRLSAELGDSLAVVVRKAVSSDELERAAAAAKNLDLGAARTMAVSAVHPSELAPLAAMSRDAFDLFRRGGGRAMEDAVAIAKSPQEIGLAARLSAGMGRATRATLKILGRGALLLTTSLTVLAGWLFAGIGYCFTVASGAAKFGRSLARVGRRRAVLAS